MFLFSVIEYSSPLRRRVKLPFVAHKNRTEIVEIVRSNLYTLKLKFLNLN